MEKVIAVFDIGKTNKKVLLFNENLKLVFQKEEKFNTINDDDGFECDDYDHLVKWIKESVFNLANDKKYDLLTVNFATYGATLAFVNANGEMATPLYNYLKPMPPGITEKFYENFGGVHEFSRCTASPALGMLNSGMQILWLKKIKPDKYAKVKHIMHLPQYLSFCFTGKVTSEYTSIGCHTALWDFDSNKYHPWLKEENVKLPEPVANDILNSISVSGKKVNIGTGIHDSSASLVPYLLYSNNEFILVSTGTWSIFMNPFNNEPLTRYQLEKDTLCYMSTLQKQVKSSRLFLGHIHDINTQLIADYFKKSPEFYKHLNLNEVIVKKVMNDFKERSVFFSNSQTLLSEHYSPDLSVFSDYDEAYYLLVLELARKAVESLHLIIPVKDNSRVIYVSGGFARNEIFTRLLATLVPEKQFFTTEIDNATALGAALTVYENTFKKPVPAFNLCLKEIKPFSEE